MFSRVSHNGIAIWEASRLGQWYSDLALLWLFGYKGEYQNRVRAEYVWEVEDVPWERPMEYRNQEANVPEQLGSSTEIDYGRETVE